MTKPVEPIAKPWSFRLIFFLTLPITAIGFIYGLCEVSFVLGREVACDLLDAILGKDE